MTRDETIKAFLKLIPTLTREETQQVKARLDFLYPVGEIETVLDDFLLTTVGRLLEAKGVPTPPPSKMKQNKAIRNLRESVPVLERWVEKVPERQRRPVLRLGTSLVIDQIEAWRIPLSFPVVFRNLYRMPGVVNTHFPGYAANGILHMLARTE